MSATTRSSSSRAAAASLSLASRKAGQCPLRSESFPGARRIGSRPRPGASVYPAALPMKIATYNVNGVNGRLPVLLQWLAQTQPDVACLQELKAPDEKFPIDAIHEAGYEAVWHGQKS